MSCRCNAVDTVPYSKFRDYVRMHIASAPVNVIDHAVRAAVIEMAKESMQMQRDLYLDVQACVQDYELCVPDMVVHAVREVHFQGAELRAVTSPAPCLPSGTFYHEPDRGILLGSTPSCDAPEGLYVRVVVHPSPDSCEVDRWVYERHAQSVAEGALSRMFLMKDMSWYDVTAAGIMFRRWKTARNRMKGEQAKHRTSGPTFMKAKRFV